MMQFFRHVFRALLPVAVFVTGAQVALSQSVPFTVGWQIPTNGESFAAPAQVWLHARVTASNIVKVVQFFNGSNSLGSVTNTSNVMLTNVTQESPFYILWSNVGAGAYSLTAVATDRSGVMATSAPISISVTNVPPPPPVAPVVYIYSPTNGSTFYAPTNLSLYARSIESGGIVATVQFFANGISLGAVSNSSVAVFTNVSTEPLFPLVWSNVPAGSYKLTAVATDTNGHTATSSVVSITVTNHPVIPFAVSFWYPTNGQSFLAPANIGIHALVTDSNVVETVQYFANGASIGIVTNTSGVLLASATQDSPFYLLWSKVPAGAYLLTALATDSAGLTATSLPVTITVTNIPPPPVYPSVYIYSPANGSAFYAPATISLYARAAESNGAIATVQFFANGTNLGIVSNSSAAIYTNISTAPLFSLTWSNVLAGSYKLTAVATDTNGHTATSSVVSITVTNRPVVPFAVGFWYPTNGQSFAAPANIGVHALVTDSNVVATVQYLANGASIGIVTNISGVLLTNTAQESPFYMLWTNVPAGIYALTAIATDSGGIMATSLPVTITVTNIPPPPAHPSVYIYSPANGAIFYAPTNLTLYARAVESNGSIATVQFFANGTNLGAVSSSNGAIYTNISTEPLYSLLWTNVLPGPYQLTAVATDANGHSATSSVVGILVTNRPAIPFTVAFWYPTNGQSFLTPANIGIHALVTDSNVIQTVQYFANGASIGLVTNTSGVLLTSATQANPFFFTWSNVAAGAYGLTAVATDSAGRTATSAPVTVYVVSNLPPVVTIYAPDPVAVAGSNNYPLPATPPTMTNYVTGSNTATFLIRRDSGTNTSGTVYYSIGGTASNGVDYKMISNYVNIPAGQRYGLVTITPLSAGGVASNRYDTVILTLIASSNEPPSYLVGSPHSAGAVILEQSSLPIPTPYIHNFADNSVHASLPAAAGMNYCVQVSTNLVDWTSICTNTVLKGSAHYVDPNPATPFLFYRVVPVPAPAAY